MTGVAHPTWPPPRTLIDTSRLALVDFVRCPLLADCRGGGIPPGWTGTRLPIQTIEPHRRLREPPRPRRSDHTKGPRRNYLRTPTAGIPCSAWVSPPRIAQLDSRRAPTAVGDLLTGQYPTANPETVDFVQYPTPPLGEGPMTHESDRLSRISVSALELAHFPQFDAAIQAGRPWPAAFGRRMLAATTPP
jgi:hypothetical protein